MSLQTDPGTMLAMSVDGCPCHACTGSPTIAVAVEHVGLRQLIVALLARDDGTWGVCACPLVDSSWTATANDADVAVVVTGDFPQCCADLLRVLPPDRIVVIGPEPERAYERAARSAGAGAWIPLDRIGEDLPAAIRSVLGCTRFPGTAALG